MQRCQVLKRDDFDDFCRGLPASTNVIQWGNASVWKVGGKIFAISSRWGAGECEKVSFKCSDMSFLLLTQRPGIVPAPYLARAKWVQVAEPDALTEADMKDYIIAAYKIVVSTLTKRIRQELGLKP